jgi:predicted nucleic acid-binding protein
MSAAETGRQFVDTNLLVYSFDPTAGEKERRAKALLAELWKRREGCVSLQVLQEFFVTVTRKLENPLPVPEAVRKVAYFTEWHLHAPGKADLLSAIALSQELRISFWDAMILQSARRMSCHVLWTEDLDNGQVYAGVLVRNPFMDMVMEAQPSGGKP